MSLTIFVLCYNRPALARLAIESIVQQSCHGFILIISDQSTNNDVEAMVKSEFPSVCYVKRPSSLKHLEHFNTCIGEVKTDYYCLFHDDDLMNPNFVEVMLKFIGDHPSAAAYACNAFIETNGTIEPRLSFISKNEYELISGPRDLAERYFSHNQSGIAPNPSYIYSHPLAGDELFIVNGGKYADVALLLDILKKGSIFWLNKPLMTYRMHGNNVGSVESIPDRLRFLGYLKKHRQEFGKAILQDYRYSFIYKKILKSDWRFRSKRLGVVKKFLSGYQISRYSRFSTYKALLKRALIKWA
ncbi:glycosyltransferase [Polynucleobacter sp. CS-Odin-A6]|uniref:glycosyltransferase family 2 protein n=1 Tax=Polynucleobacter sp. CS-Odin-A6 TaxID=2689106 RepID=UPI001C0DA680|nr:glycosyltransferase [Polynucleobacter sp. CS-Odin-A6]